MSNLGKASDWTGVIAPWTVDYSAILGDKKLKQQKKMLQLQMYQDAVEHQQAKENAARQEAERKRKKKERDKFVGVINANLKMIRNGITRFDTNYRKALALAKENDLPADEISQLPDVISAISASTAGLAMPTDPTAMEQLKIDTDEWVWVVDESNRRLMAYAKSAKDHAAYKQEQAQIEAHRLKLLEIAAREAKAETESRAFYAEIEKRRSEQELLKKLRKDLAAERAALAKERQMIEAARRELSSA